ncbi:hypothetical protein BH09PSE1_BH09PSE1_05720 [soil metagenome]
MALFSVQLANQCVVLDLGHDELASVREELCRTRYLTGQSVDFDDGNGSPVDVLISAASIRWICSGRSPSAARHPSAHEFN